MLLVAVCLASALFAKGDVLAARSTVVTQVGASPSELHAAQELRDHLAKITGVDIPLRQNADSAPSNAIIVGQGAIAQAQFPEVQWAKLGDEQTLIRSHKDVLLIAGGGQRGTLYAVYRFLQVKCGVRWWTPWATTIPKNANLTFADMDWTETPAFEYRDPYWFHAFDPDWAVRNFDNGFNIRTDAAHGGKTLYQGFVHTYNGLVPPDKFFPIHPEWFSLINGKRTFENAQLCTTNPDLRDYVVEEVRRELRANPAATIVSVSQNDCFNPCQCEVCRALAKKEGSDSALVLDLANYVAEHIAKEFPHVAVDTLAYQWSRHPPAEMRPLPNVIVRLCSIEGNMGYPLFAPQNAAFASDIRGWNRLTNRLYVWDYCTDFADYLQPTPDYLGLGPSLQWLNKNGVRGVFEEGAYQSYGGDMAELKAWLIAQILWDPKQDPSALVDEFLRGYYGEAAAAPIRRYLELMTAAVKDSNVTFSLGPNTPFLNYEVMSKAQKLWSEARQLARGSGPEYVTRVANSALSMESVWLSHWQEFKRAALQANDPWPYPRTRQATAEQWQNDCEHSPIPITIVDEGGMTPAVFVRNLGPEPPAPVFHALPPRGANPPPPAGLPAGVDYQDDLASLWQAPDNSELRSDPLASDGIACWMPGSHHEWGFQLPLSKKPVTGRYHVYVVVRLDRSASDGSAAFSAGVYDFQNKKDLAAQHYTLNDVGNGYKAYDLGAYDINSGLTVWVAPPSNPTVQAVWVDRVYLVKV